MRRIYVVDMGAGNTNAYWIDPQGVKPASLLANENGEASGYIVPKKDDRVINIGNDALYGMEYTDLSLVKEYHLNWKQLPTEKNRAELTRYFRAWNEKIRNERAQDFIGVSPEEEIWFIGCPTGGKWKQASIRNLYKEFLEDAGFRNVTVIPESNGALAFYQKSRKILDDLQANTKVILFDLGAYSIDATSFDGNELTSYGQYLGASLIEKMMVRAVLYGIQGNPLRFKGKALNDPDIIKEACKEYENRTDNKNEVDGKIFRDFLRLKARSLKEDFFRAQSEGKAPTIGLAVYSGYFHDFGDNVKLYMDLLFSEDLRKTLMERMPIRDLLGDEFDEEPPEVREYIGDATWMQSLENFLNETAKEFSLDDGSNVRIMLTGGGSLMKCVQDKVRSRFPNAEVYDGKESVIAIGYGLAEWGPDKVLAMDFEKKFRDDFLQIQPGIEPDDWPLFKTLSGIYVQCVSDNERPFTNKAEEIFSGCVDGWKNYRYGSTEITDRCSEKLVDWFKTTWVLDFNRMFADSVEELKRQLNAKFENSVVDPLHLRTILADLITLLPPNDQDFLAHLAKLHELDFNSISDKTSEHFKKLSSWFTDFNNDDKPGVIKSIFGSSDPRRDYYNGLCNHWREKYHEEFSLSSLTDNFLTRFIHHWLCVAYWYEDNPKSTNENIFSMQVMVTLLDAMELRKKAILGKLVLEEILSEEK